MMDWLRGWLLGVTGAAVLWAMVNSLMPPGGVRQVGRLLGGVVLLMVMIKPVVSLPVEDLEHWLESYGGAYGVEMRQLEEERDQTMKTIIEQSCAAYILDKAEALGGSYTVQVVCTPQGEGGFVPSSVVIQGSLTPQQRQELTRQIAQELSIPPEDQTYWTEEELP